MPDDDAASSVAADNRMMQQVQPKSAATGADAPTVRSSSWPILRVGTLLSTSYTRVSAADQHLFGATQARSAPLRDNPVGAQSFDFRRAHVLQSLFHADCLNAAYSVMAGWRLM
jgi:hypothetical protein